MSRHEATVSDGSCCCGPCHCPTGMTWCLDVPQSGSILSYNGLTNPVTLPWLMECLWYRDVVGASGIRWDLGTGGSHHLSMQLRNPSGGMVLAHYFWMGALAAMPCNKPVELLLQQGTGSGFWPGAVILYPGCTGYVPGGGLFNCQCSSNTVMCASDGTQTVNLTYAGAGCTWSGGSPQIVLNPTISVPDGAVRRGTYPTNYADYTGPRYCSGTTNTYHRTTSAGAGPHPATIEVAYGACPVAKAPWPAPAPGTPAHQLILPMCRYREGDTGETALCPSCGGGKVRLKVFGCSVHGTCTIDRQAEGVQMCTACPDREAPP